MFFGKGIPRLLIISAIVLIFSSCSVLTTSYIERTDSVRNKTVIEQADGIEFNVVRQPTNQDPILQLTVSRQIARKEHLQRKYLGRNIKLKPGVKGGLWVVGLGLAGYGYYLDGEGQIVLGRNLMGIGALLPFSGKLITGKGYRDKWQPETNSISPVQRPLPQTPITITSGKTSWTERTDHNGRISTDITKLTSEAEPGEPLDIYVALRDNRSQSKRITIPSHIVAAHLLPPAYPPDLRVASIQFIEPSGNNILDAEESAIIRFMLQNMGRGRAQRISINTQSRGTAASKVQYTPSMPIGNLEPNDHRRIEIPIQATAAIRDGQVTFRVQISEMFGFDASPFDLTIETLAFRPPRFAIADIGIDDATRNGMIEPGEVVTVVVLVKNEGQGTAERVIAKAINGDGVFFSGNSPTVFDLGSINPGEAKPVEFEVYTNRRATSMSVMLSVDESLGSYGLPPTPLDLPFNKPMRGIPEIVVEGTPPISSGSIRGVSVDIEKDIPQGRDRRDIGVALIIANETYQHKDIPEVEFAKRDGEFVKQYLIKTLRYPPDKVFIVENATYGNLRTYLQLLRNITDSSSEVFVYYTGHGASSLGEEAQPYIVTYDCDPNFVQQAGMALDEFYRGISQLKAKQIWVVVDACFSGMSGGGPIVQDISIIAPRIKYPAVADNRMTIFTSASGQEVSSWYREMKHSLYTYYFLKGLRGEADQNKDREISTEELQSYLLEMVPTKARSLYNREQYPGLFTGGKTQVLVRY